MRDGPLIPMASRACSFDKVGKLNPQSGDEIKLDQTDKEFICRSHLRLVTGGLTQIATTPYMCDGE